MGIILLPGNMTLEKASTFAEPCDDIEDPMFEIRFAVRIKWARSG
jgi:hypothetical protein